MDEVIRGLTKVVVMAGPFILILAVVLYVTRHERAQVKRKKPRH